MEHISPHLCTRPFLRFIGKHHNLPISVKFISVDLTHAPKNHSTFFFFSHFFVILELWFISLMLYHHLQSKIFNPLRF